VRIFIMTDQEGVAGVGSFGDCALENARGVQRANRLLTAEVNAAVEGALAAGATEIVVMDGHGDGAIVYEELHPRASLIHGRPASPRWRDEVRGHDATLFVGQHAMAGTPDADMNHTQDSLSITSIMLNGELIGEIAQWALYAGSWGVPAIFLSGDEAACREFQALVPGGVTAAVKRGLGRSTAVSLSAEEARRRIRDGARTALERHRAKPFPPVVRTPPFVLEKRFFTSQDAERYLERADAKVLDPLTVRISGADIRGIIFA
jgi:D-amino peptidase